MNSEFKGVFEDGVNDMNKLVLCNGDKTKINEFCEELNKDKSLIKGRFCGIYQLGQLEIKNTNDALLLGLTLFKKYFYNTIN